MNLLKKRSENVYQNEASVKEDIALLAFICIFCEPNVKKRGILGRHYAYYIPKETQDLSIAKDLFKRNGINMHVHYSHIKSKSGQDVLRMGYSRGKDYEKEKEFLYAIKQQQKDFFYGDYSEQELSLQEKILKLREQQNKKVR